MIPAIRCANVSKRYGRRAYGVKEALVGRHSGKHHQYSRKLALHNVSFTAPLGSAFGVLGHNGTGKSTLLSLLLGVITPDQGTIEVNGKVASLLALGSGFHSELTGRENITLYGSILGMSLRHIRKHMDAIIEFSELHDVIENPIRTYSSGMIARLGFSTIIHIGAEILLIDEVLAVGDSDFQAKCKNYLRDFRHSHGSLVIVSHDLGTLAETCDDGICLHRGQVAHAGPIGEVIDFYQTKIAVDS